jgi:hypothetical protein
MRQTTGRLYTGASRPEMHRWAGQRSRSFPRAGGLGRWLPQGRIGPPYRERQFGLRGKAEAAVVEPPAIELAGVDPAVVRAVEAAQEALNQAPRSADAWGQLGKTLLAHGFYVPAYTCLAQAERLDPIKVHWPYLQGIALISSDPPDPAQAIEKYQRAV